MELIEGRYYAIHFDDVSSAVNYCGAMVTHVVTRLRGGEQDGVERPAIWFHAAPPVSGCDLIMTRGAILAAMAGGLQTPSMSPTSRTSLPAGAVLVLGEDSRQAPLAPRTRRSMPALHAPNRINQRSA
jgi:hypothetical protein